MGSNLYPALVRFLEEAGCSFVRNGKGSHEIWHSPLSKRNFTVPGKIVIPHTANGAPRDAGLPKAF
jgi:predicted RNA binding protein YcfA (HicA-like mRNA interferase family)